MFAITSRVAYALACVVLLASCGGGSMPAASGTSRSAAASGPKTVEIKLTDAGCDPATIKLDAGRTTFKVTNGGTGRVSELEVLSEGPEVDGLPSDRAGAVGEELDRGTRADRE